MSEEYKCLAVSKAACAWPDCGCDPHATKVIAALVDQGWIAPPECGGAAQALPDAALRAAAKKVLDANFDFRNGLPADWEGDPLQDACDELMTALGCSVPSAEGK